MAHTRYLWWTQSNKKETTMKRLARLTRPGLLAIGLVLGANFIITLACIAPAGLTCAFRPSTISPGSGSSSTLTISAASSPPATGYHASRIAAMMPGLGLFGTFFTARKKKLLNPEEHGEDEPTGLAACYLTVRSWMQWQQQFKQTNNARISTGHRDGDGHIRLTEPILRCDRLHQLNKPRPNKGVRECAPCFQRSLTAPLLLLVTSVG